uniref:Zinc finger protein-like 1 n=1 Tax=Melopsittacus undulatus TaxID=13146 RepID=A0A8V5GNG3_MELUD
MGLCKCPKRRVTNLFCFEHRVNVCESCLVSAHPKVPGGGLVCYGGGGTGGGTGGGGVPMGGGY